MSSTSAPEPISLPHPVKQRPMQRTLPLVLPLVIAVAAFLMLGAYQLDLPGLHYDEAKEAGLNAVQLLRGQPVTAFRDATVTIGPWRIPLMVQDYIGNLNVLLALPFLAVGGVNTLALRMLPLFLALLTLIFTWKLAARLGGPLAAGTAVLLLAFNPSFVFWSRQGIFVTNITALLFMAALFYGVVWWQERRARDLVLAAFFSGLGVYAKLLFVWAVIAVVIVGAVALWRERRGHGSRPLPHLSTLAPAALAFVIPLLPLLLFNLRTGGTLLSIVGNLGQSYYGVDNSEYIRNLGVRLGQFVTLLHGDHFWYLGELYANPLAPWLLLALVLAAIGASVLSARRRLPVILLPLSLLGLIVLQSAFTVSDLFITHFALFVPLVPLTAGLAVAELGRLAPTAGRRALVLLPASGLLLALVWVAADAYNVFRYHRALTISGGYAAHSDAIYRLAGYLDQEGYTTPIVLDWGIDAPLSFLTEGRVTPVDVFGYDRLDAPDPAFATRIGPHLEDWQSVYVGHPSDKAVFKGRIEAIAVMADERDFRWLEQEQIAQRSGEPVFIIYRFQH